MVQVTSYKTVRGLDQNANPFAGTPGKDATGSGRTATLIADNCILSRQRMISNRKGFDYFSKTTTALINALFEYQNYLIQHQTDNTLWRGDQTSGTRTQYTGTYVPPPGCRMDATVSRGSFYFTTTDGVYKLDSATATPIKAGLPKALDTRVQVTGGSGFMPVSSRAAYHVTWTRTDANKQTLRSDVSSRVVVTNTSTTATCNVLITFTVPYDIHSGDAYGDSYEIWRTVTVDATNPDPGDDAFLVAKTLNITPGGQTISFTDTTPDAILINSTPLYTNATQQTAIQGNARPPFCKAICNYKDYTLYGNTAIDHQITMNLLAVVGLTPTTSKIIINTTAGSRDYTCGTTENVATRTFQLFTGGVSNAFNIEQTVKSLVHVINGDSVSPCYAEYNSGPNDNPGIFRVWARSPLGGSFWLTANSTGTGNQFNPALPVTGNTVTSSNDARPNRLFYSKFQEPDHVPILNTIDVGRLDQPILRILAVRDAAYVIKADGIYYLSGLSAPFTLIELDTTCHCIAPATAVTLNNQIFMLSNQGIVKLALSGVTVISFPIEPFIMGPLLVMDNLANVAFAIGHEVDRHYLLWLPTNGSDTYATQAYCFHTFVEEWTRFTKPAAAGIASNLNYSLYLSSGLENALLKQRRDGIASDYSDEEIGITINIPDVSTDHFSLEDGTGDVLLEDSTGYVVQEGGA